MIQTGGGLLAVFALVLANGFFVAAEFSLVTVRRTRVEQLAEEGRLGARHLQDAVGKLDSYIAACQLGITMASLALGWIGEPMLAGLLEPIAGGFGAHSIAVAVAFLVITALHVIAGELAPKGLALQYPERTALVIVGPLRLFRAIFRPAIWALNESGWLVAGLIGVPRGMAREGHLGATELRLVVEQSAKAGELEESERFMIERVLRFSDLTVEAVMVPRTEVLALPVETSTEDAIEFVGEHHHSRYPVYRESLDDVVGVLHIRDVLLAEAAPSLEPLLRRPLMMPTQASVRELLTEMRERSTHFAVAVDEYGGTDGIVTLEDVLEEIVGELQDEFEETPPAHEARPDGVFRIDGLDSVDVLSELLRVDVEPGPYNTVAGYILDQIGRMPEIGDSVDLRGYRLTVVEMDELRIAAVEATPMASPARRDQA